ncbi:MAG: divalent-cation tolerance protein CutA [Gammaproteobacteria bacterium]|nr:divalent-cation tolerance protein CutA [Gammaproteobacteria bacterium]
MKKNNISKPVIYQLLICACPDEEIAINIAENIVAQKLAASANILPAVYSVYQYQDNVESAKENLILIKTIKKNYRALEQVICNLHPYEIPEIIAIDINNGLPEYLKWIRGSINL